jgi:hypothetical protein
MISGHPNTFVIGAYNAQIVGVVQLVERETISLEFMLSYFGFQESSHFRALDVIALATSWVTIS